MLRHPTPRLARTGPAARSAATRPAAVALLAGRAARTFTALACAALLAGCSGADGTGVTSPPPPPLPPPPTDTVLALGERLFDAETFGGNGRTCVTCHMRETGTITIEAVAERLARDPADALFRHDGLDGGDAGVSRIAANATVRVELQLPPFVTLANDPARRTIVVNRGVPSTINTPALDGGVRAALMYDLRHNDLQAQALDAVRGHAKSTVTPTAAQLDAIAAFEKGNDRFFSSAAIRTHARGGPQPELPAGNTESERRGRLFFLDKAVAGTKQGMCGECHAGANLNEVSELGARESGSAGLLPGAKFGSTLVAETNRNHDPLYTFRVDDGAGDVRLVSLPDPGILLTDRRSASHLAAFQQAGLHPAVNAGFFKTPSLWGVRLTPPYFHDNSAKTLRDVVDHYANVFFKRFTFVGAFVELTEQDRQDIVAFLRLL